VNAPVVDHPRSDPSQPPVAISPAATPLPLDYTRPPRARRWRAVWQLPLLWGLPAATATAWALTHDAAKVARDDWFLSLAGIGLVIPTLLRVPQQELRLVLGLPCGMAAFMLIGLLFDLLVEHGDDDSWWDRHWTLTMTLALAVLFALYETPASFDGWCLVYAIAILVQAALMLLTAAVWALTRVWRFARGSRQ